MKLLKNFLFFDFQSSDFGKHTNKSDGNNIKYQVTQIISICIILQSSGNLFEDHLLIHFDDNKNIILGWILIFLNVLFLVQYKIFNKKLAPKHFKIFHSVYPLIYFILQGLFFHFYVMKNGSEQTNDSFYKLWNTMIWILLILIISNPLVKFISISTIIIYFSAYYTTTNTLNHILNSIWLITTSGLVIYLTTRWQKLLFDDMSNRLKEMKIYKKISKVLPESLVIISHIDKEPLHFNNASRGLFQNGLINDFSKTISNIKNLKIRNFNSDFFKNCCDIGYDQNSRIETFDFEAIAMQILSSNIVIKIKSIDKISHPILKKF